MNGNYVGYVAGADPLHGFLRPDSANSAVS